MVVVEVSVEVETDEAFEGGFPAWWEGVGERVGSGGGVGRVGGL